jgi:hypothetical protein
MKVGVDIHALEDDAFRASCENGHIEIAKWLYSLGGVDIHAANDDAFRRSCERQRIESIIFLLHIDTNSSTSQINSKYDYVHKLDLDNAVTKLLFDVSFQAGHIDNKIKLTDQLTNKYTIQKQEILSRITDHLIPDIATMIYYYV